MIDTHAHLDFKDFDKDREEVISRAFDNARLDLPDGGRARQEVKAIINVGVDLERSRKSIEIAEKHKNVYAAVGLHPDFFNKVEKESTKLKSQNTKQNPNYKVQNYFSQLQELAKNRKVVAIGETGLDYYSHTNEPITGAQKENQKAGFLAQIEIAKELGLPVIVHCREVYPVASPRGEHFGAWDDLHEIISKFSQNSAFQSESDFSLPPFAKGGIPQSRTFFVLHCYSGEKKDTEKFLRLPNVYFSFSGNITYSKPADRAEKLAEAVRMIPLERIMLDSDSPFLAPQEFRGKRNEPAYIKHIAEKIAKIKEIIVEEVEKETDRNAEKFFKL